MNARHRRGSPRWLAPLALAGLVAGGALVAFAVLRLSASAPRAGASLLEQAAAVPEPVRPAFRPGRPVALRRSPETAEWAPVRRAVTARKAPRPGAGPVTRLSTDTPEGTTNLVLVVDRQVDRSGHVWVQARLPVLPNGTTGWIPRDALGGYVALRTRLVIDTERLEATLFRDGRAVFRADVGIGKPEWPTPKGEFYIRNRITSFDDPAYGPLAFGTSARSAVLTDWPAGGFVGIHGTNHPELLPGRVSHGCIRLRNDDILHLARLMPVGTPVTVR